MKKVIEKLLSIRELEVIEVELSEDVITIYCESKLEEKICPKCLKKCKVVKSYDERTIRDLPISGKRIYLKLWVRQFSCENCDMFFYEEFEFVRPKSRYTKRYEKYVFEYSRASDMTAISKKEGLNWKTVRDIVKRWSLIKIKKHISWAVVKRIGIDEIALKKGIAIMLL